MIQHRGVLVRTTSVLLLLFATSHCQSNSRSYDTSDWIPVSRPCPTCFQNTENQAEINQKKPSGRVLNLPANDQKQFFPEEQINLSPQTYRGSAKQYANLESQQEVQQSRQVPKLHEVTTFVPGGQHVLLPPQLQNIISQGQSVLSPHRINAQLLQDVPFQQTIPNEELPGNITHFTSKDIGNLNLYNQQAVKANQLLQQRQQNIKQNINNGAEEVQLIYVPLENLRPKPSKSPDQQITFPTEQPYIPVPNYNRQSQHYQTSLPHKQAQLHNIEQDFVQQALQAQKLQEQFQHTGHQISPQNFHRPYVQEPSTLAPAVTHKKRKPHQPPLAVYMSTEGHQDVKVTDVLSLLKDAKSISVQDTVGPDSPEVFVGPSHLEPPEGYVKFDLPYLSSIEGNRVERKVDQLPFFVAPLSYKAPPGYSKIPFPAPHVGSVVINHMKDVENGARIANQNNLSEQNVRTTEGSIFPENIETSTQKTRTRLRQPARVSYSPLTIPPPPSADIPYQSIPKESLPQQHHSIGESLISSNPYGPTEFVQTTTPVYDVNANPIPQQLFSTYARFSTPTPYLNLDVEKQPANVPQAFTNQIKQTTKEPSASSTQSSAINNSKYTVLEQFPISENGAAIKYSEDNITPTVTGRQHLRNHQTQNRINTNTEQPTQSPSLHKNQPQSPVSTKEQYDHQYIPVVTHAQSHNLQAINQNQDALNKQEYLQHYNQQTPKLANQQVLTEQQHLQAQIQQGQVLHLEREPSVRNSQPHTRERGAHQFIPENNYQTQYKIHSPNETPTAHDQITQQINKESNSEHTVPQTSTQVKSPLGRSRGRQHFTPHPYYDEENEKTEERAPVKEQFITKVPTSDFDVQVPTQPPTRNSEKTPYFSDPYYDITQEPEEQEFILPIKLPVITPQLPTLINSLEDQAIRPLLAPLLIPPSEQPPVTDSTPEYYTSQPPPTTTSTTTTPAPITETTTPFKRVRSRYRGTRPTFSYEYTTASSRRPSSYRGRRPYNGRPRNEYYKPTQYLEEVTPTTATIHQAVTSEAPLRSNTGNRNRFAIQRDRSYSSSTTDIPRRTLSNGRQRFRTRGRPAQNDDEYNSFTDKTTTVDTQGFKQPVLEAGFQASVPISHGNVYLPEQLSHVDNSQNEQILIHRPQQDQPNPYELKGKQINQDHLSFNINSDDYNSREHSASTANPVVVEPHTSIPVSAPEDNVVGDPNLDDSTVIVKTNDELKYLQNTERSPPVLKHTQDDEIIYNTRAPQIENTQLKTGIYHTPYIEYEADVRVTPTTESSTVRSRTRTRQRIRGHSTVFTTRQHLTPSTTTTIRTTTEENDDSEEKEFYGFFRQPNFQKPVEIEYKKSSDLPNPIRSSPNVAYLSREKDDQPVYVNTPSTQTDSSPHAYLPIHHTRNIHADSHTQTQHHVLTTPEPSTTTTEDITMSDIKPITRRPSNNFIRSRRPTVAPNPKTEIPTRSQEKYYTVRPSRRPESQTPKVTRIRGRIRKPTKSTTTPAPLETDAPFLNNHQPIKELYLPSNDQEYVTPVRQRERVYNRGRTHFQYPSSDKYLTTDEPESPNYPTSFLEAQGLVTSRSTTLLNIQPSESPELSSQEIATPKTAFQLTIEPDNVDDEYVDQLPYSSKSKLKVTVKDLDEGAESQFSAKIIQTPNSFNYIGRNEEKNTPKVEQELKEDLKSEINKTKEESAQDVQQQVTTTKQDDSTQYTETTTEFPTTTTNDRVTEKQKNRKRGYWRLVKQRPLSDVLESAESQNIGTIYSNVFEDEKPEKKYKTIQRVKTTTESIKQDTTLLPEFTTVPSNIPNVSEVEISRPEDEMLAPLYKMFGLEYDHTSNENWEPETNAEIPTTTTELSTVFKEYPERVETTTSNDFNLTAITEPPSSTEDETLVYSDNAAPSKTAWEPLDESWKNRIIGTSTTTEVSHETEICYRGRCVKSATSDNSSEA